MSLAVLSVIALVAVIVVSCISKLNVGLLAIVIAWILGVYFGGMTTEAVAAGFPVSLFLTLTGVLILFTQAQLNGTLDKLAHRALRLCRGNTGLIPIVVFLLGATLASIGPGNIAAAALLAPLAMPIAQRAGIPALLMALIVGNGVNAGGLSPLAPTGVIANGLLQRIGLPGLEANVYLANFGAHALVAGLGFILFGGLRLFRARYAGDFGTYEPLTRLNWLTLGAIAAMVVAVIFFRANVGMAALLAAVVLGVLRVADPGDAIRKLPWAVIVMVCGVTVLISLLEKNGGLELFAKLVANLATPGTVTAVVAFLTAWVSAYSSTSGVVLPAFLPLVPGLAERLGADAAGIALSICVGSHLVDVSPLSTIGALCIAAAPSGDESRTLFNRLMAWGISMTFVAAVYCYLVFGLR